MSPRNWLIYFKTLLCRSNGSINYTARTVVRLYVSLETRAEWRTTNLFWVPIKSRTTTNPVWRVFFSFSFPFFFFFFLFLSLLPFFWGEGSEGGCHDPFFHPLTFWVRIISSLTIIVRLSPKSLCRHGRIICSDEGEWEDQELTSRNVFWQHRVGS